MTKSKKLSMFIFSLLLVFASLLFVACGGKDYSNTTLTSSESSIELFVDEQKNVTFTINNPVDSMSKDLNLTFSNPQVCKIEQTASQEYSTTYTITGLKGGNTILDVSTLEGGKKTSININVKQYSDKLEAADNSLYVSASSNLTPSSADFIFENSSTERDLNFYFYGKTQQKGNLVLEDVIKDNNFVNEFVSVELFSVQEKNFLIFEDINGKFYTLDKGSIVAGSNNVKYQFIEVEKTEEGYEFNLDNVTAVSAGDEFTFIANYQTNSEEQVYCERSFYVLVDINSDSISHVYGYQVEGMNFVPGSDTSYKIDELSEGKITLIPNYTSTIMNGQLIGEVARFNTIFLEVTIETTNDLLLMNADTENDKVVNSTILGKTVSNGYTTYYIQINSNTGSASSTYYDVTFYYKGFENSNDDNVNFTYSIPVDVRVIPTGLLVNNVDLNAYDKEYTFYNSYAGSSYGWQAFQFTVTPGGAEYDSLLIDLTNSDLQLKYKNTVYTNQVVEITDLKDTVYIKGLDGAEITTEIKKLPIQLNFNIIQEDSMSTEIKYKIVKGATVLDFKTDEYRENIYLDINNKEPISFKDLYADAEFSSIEFTLVNGIDVASFSYDKNAPYSLEGIDYYLDFSVTPKQRGTGTYNVSLDNGKQISLTITVLESLNKVFVESTNEQRIINNTVNTPATEDQPASTLFYVYNKNNSGYFDIKVISNDDVNSTAINSVETKLSNQLIQLGEATDNNKKFNVYIRANGSSQIELAVYGYQVKNFIRNEILLTYYINIVSYDFIENLYVYKTQDGMDTYPSKTNAAYGYVYSNTSLTEARTLQLEIAVKNQDAYLFSNPSTGEYIADSFGIEYLYWESPQTNVPIYRNGIKVDKMYFSSTGTNVYTLGNYGTFDASSLTFTAYSNLSDEVNFSLIAHVRQYGYTYSYTVNIRIYLYEEVAMVSLQNSIVDNTIEFSAIEREKTLIAYATNSTTATNPEIVAIFEGGQITVDENTYTMFDPFDEDDYIESDGKYQISLKVNEDFIKYAENYTGVMQGVLYIVAADWLDGSGNIKSEYQDRVNIAINITFANGTENNRFTIDSAEDLLAMKDNLSAHYQLKTTVNVSLISSQLPLGELKGSIIGTNEYATITGINITTPYEEIINEFTTNYYYGLFTKIDENAYINYITFEGEFNVGDTAVRHSNSYVGLVAGVNKGSLVNVGVTINTSSIYISNGNVGGLVGANEGLILQDFTLFDSNTSTTRSKDFDQFVKTSQGVTKESIYSGLTPKITVYMNGFMNVYYTINDNDQKVYTRIGGVTGYNNGIIRKIDVDKNTSSLKVNGYTNYMAYSLIKAIPDNTDVVSRSYIGGLVGENENISEIDVVTGGLIQGGYNTINDENIVFTNYKTYQQIVNGSEGDKATIDGDFIAGNGIVVGGEVWGYGYVGGVVGYINFLDSSDSFAGITARAFIRGQKMNDNVSNIAVIANIQANNGVNSAFAIQSVDDGKTGEEASIAVLYNNDVNDEINRYMKDTDALAFGLGSTNIDVMSDFAGEENQKEYENVFSYLISRDKMTLAKDEDAENALDIEYSNKSIYYGDIVVVASSNDVKKVIGQNFFNFGNEGDLSLSAMFNNKMQSDTNSAYEIYYMYYFKAGSTTGDTDISDAQSNLDSYLNKVNASNKTLYPFNVNGEMIFTSKNQDILTIDQSGKITVKKTGLAQISGSSVLNTNNALTFYIYVVNYFNSESTIENNDERSSIVYPVASTSSVPLDDSTIELRGNNSATIYVMPKYELEMQVSSNSNFESNRNGEATLNGIVFNLAGNDNVSAEVIEETQNIDINVIGTSITFRKKSHTAENYYPLEIKPRLELSITEGNEKVVYYAYVNKTLSQTKVDYRYGALSMDNVNYNEVTIHTSKIVKDVITIESTDGGLDQEKLPKEKPLYYIVDFNNQNIQGSVDGFEYKYDENDQLFIVSFDYDPISSSSNENGIYYHKYNLSVSINRNSSAYLNRYTENIYGEYILNIQASSNSGVTKSIKIIFEKTNVTSIVVDNYTTLTDATNNSGLSSVSEYAFPGVSGLLAITVTPEDSDFDYILVENADENYNPGNASANFGFLARKNSEKLSGDEKLFDRENISGSSTAKGIRLSLEDIINIYNKTDKSGNLYEKYNGIIYIQYDMGSENVIDESISSIRISLIKDGEVSYSVVKNLKIKLQNFVTVEIDGKDGQYNQDGYYAIFEVARGLKYKLNINNYGFDINNVQLSIPDSNLGTIVQENGEYYLQITKETIDYTNDDAYTFEILISATEQEGEVTRNASSKTKIIVNEYVVNYNGGDVQNPDIITNMGEGIVNVQVGTQTTFAVDIYDYIEYDATNNEVISKIDQFMQELSQKGKWTSYTNLISDLQPDYGAADDENEFPSNGRKKYDLGFNKDQEAYEGSNYYYNYEGLNVLPSKTHNPTDYFYYFVYEGGFKKENGVYTYSEPNEEQGQSNIIKTKFTLNVYTSSSEDSPIPVYDYKDFIGMQEGGYYILLNDITLPNTTNDDGSITAFTPLNGNFASFDGNGHTINLAGTYDMGSLSTFGIFSSLNSGSIIKNLNVNYTSANDGSDMNTDPNDKTYDLFGLKTVKFITTASSFTFGGIVANNSGIITNCHVYTDDSISEYYITVKADSALDSTSYIGGLVGNNGGYITNSTVSINVKSPFNTAGVVALNSGKVSGCYFKEGKLINNSQFDQHVAGFAITNSESAQILTSFVSGAQSNLSIYSQDSNSYISSTLASAGFVYQNSGTISDCYTDIDLSKTTSDMAGFVFYNGGNIENSFSLSVLRNNVTASAGFARYNNLEGTNGTFANCYYFYNEQRGSTSAGSNQTLDEDGFIVGQGNINTSLVQVTYEGIDRLNAGGFGNLEENFESYSYQSNMGTNAVWFFSNGNTSSTYVDYIPTTDKVTIEGEDGQTQTNTIYRTENKIFGLNRLELINPNIAALSIKNFSYSEVDDITGDTVYYYVDDSSAPNRGSIHNPRLIYNASTMESEILEQTSSAGLNITNYRIISDINYNDFEGLSQLYTVTFAGILEGNGMEISSITMATMEKMQKAGLFGQIGYSASKTGTVKNLTIIPKQVAFTNTNNVGVLAGVLKYGSVYDVSVKISDSSETTTVSGMNFVGGIIGKAITSYTIKDVYSSINVSASYSPQSDSSYDETFSADNSFSYAGSIAGFLGTGTLYNAHVDSVTSVMGGRAGLAYGGLGRGAKINYTYVDVASGASIKAYQYGGYITGETAGTLKYSYVSSNSSTESSFSVVPKAAMGVGGISGLMLGGTIDNAVMYQDFRVVGINSNNTAIRYVGGIVGIVSASTSLTSTIKNCIIDSDITSSAIVGGAVGQVSSAARLDCIAVKSTSLSVQGQIADPVLGGIVGKVENRRNASVSMSNSYCLADLNVDTSTSGIKSTASIGGLIGSSEERLPELYYCYTTSKITANVYDSRALDKTQDFENYLKKGESDDTSLPEGYNFATFTYDTHNDKDYNNVYYFGYSVSGDQNSISGGSDAEGNEVYPTGTISHSPFVEFTTKVKSTAIGVTVNNYGESSVNFYNSKFTVANNTDKTALNELFGIDYDYKITDNMFIDNLRRGIKGNETYYKGTINEKDLEFNVTSDDKTKFEEIISSGDTNYSSDLFINSNSGFVEYEFEDDNNVKITATYNNGTFNLNGELYTYGEKLSDGSVRLIKSSPTGESITKTFKSSTITFTIDTKDTSKLVQTTELRNSAGEDYKHYMDEIKGQVYEILENLNTGAKYAKVGDVYKSVIGTGETEEIQSTELKDVPTQTIWVINANGFSTLYFESQLDWLNRK